MTTSPTERLDEETEQFFALMYTEPGDVDCHAMRAIRRRIRTLIEEARKEGMDRARDEDVRKGLEMLVSEADSDHVNFDDEEPR